MVAAVCLDLTKWEVLSWAFVCNVLFWFCFYICHLSSHANSRLMHLTAYLTFPFGCPRASLTSRTNFRFPTTGGLLSLQSFPGPTNDTLLPYMWSISGYYQLFFRGTSENLISSHLISLPSLLLLWFWATARVHCSSPLIGPLAALCPIMFLCLYTNHNQSEPSKVSIRLCCASVPNAVMLSHFVQKPGTCEALRQLARTPLRPFCKPLFCLLTMFFVVVNWDIFDP